VPRELRPRPRGDWRRRSTTNYVAGSPIPTTPRPGPGGSSSRLSCAACPSAGASVRARRGRTRVLDARSARRTALKCLKRQSHLVITRTFSKPTASPGCASASARPGERRRCENACAALQRERHGLAAAVAALDDMEFVARSYALSLDGMKQLEEARAGSSSTSSRRTATSSPSRSPKGENRRPKSTSGCCAGRDRAADRRYRCPAPALTWHAAENEKFSGARASFGNRCPFRE